jgi:3-oxoacyl-[acyl-carrier protein] reductase
MVEKAKEHFSKLLGKFQIDIVVNNAGVAKDAEIPDVDWKTFEWIYKINVWGPIKVMQAVLPYLPHDRSGRIVNVSSVSSTQGFIGQTMYGGTKAALEAMTRSWSREVAERATVNSINPGPVHTEMWSGTSALFRQRTNAWMRHTPLAAARPEIDTEGVMKGADELGGREAYPEEIAGIIGMLCTPDSSWCTGQSICANGGFIFN